MKLNILFAASSVASLLFVVSNSYGAEEASKEERLDSLLVIGDSVSISTDQLAGSHDVIGRDELDYEHPDDTYELFNKAPGVYIARYNQGIINTDVAIRGFAGDGVTPHAKLLIDGVPFNLHNGYGELDQLFPLDIENIELFKGTSDARYGLFNLAGNYNVASRRDIAKEIKVTLGSYDTAEVQSYIGLESGRLTHNYFLGYRQSDGYRDHTDIEKLEASGKWFYALDDSNELGLSLRHSTYDAESPGYFDVKEDARNDPTSSASHSSEDGGDKTITHYSIHYNKALSEGLDWSNKIYYNDIERNRWVRFFSTSNLQERVDDQQQTGFVTTLDWTINDKWFANIGADIEQQDVIEQRFTHSDNVREGAGNPSRDRDYTLDTIGAFVTIEQTPSDYLRWNIGVRVDHLDGDYTDKISNVDRDIFDFGTIVQPKANVFVTPNDDLTVFVNYGESFQHPYGSALYDNPNSTSDDRSDVSTHEAWELGTKWFASDDVELRVSYWEHYGEDEFLDLDGFQQVIGDTERRGIDLGANVTASDRVELWLNYSFLDSEIVDPNSDERADNASTRGNELRSIPEYTASLGINYQITPKLSSRIHIDSQGDYYINENNQGGKFGGYTLVSTGFDYETSWGALNLQINNLFDEYYEYVYDFGNTGTANIYSPGDGINASLTYSYKF